MRWPSILLFAAAVVAMNPPSVKAQDGLAAYASHVDQGRSVVVTTTRGQRMRLTPYGDFIIRVQIAEAGEDFARDTLYETVVTHDWPGGRTEIADAGALALLPASGQGLTVRLFKNPLRLAFSDAARGTVWLTEHVTGARTGNRPLGLEINGTLVETALAFPRTPRWDAWATARVRASLPAGESTVRLTAIGASGPNVDRLTVELTASEAQSESESARRESFLPGTRPSGAAYEAEDAILSGAVRVRDGRGAHGGGYADFINADGDFIEWRVTVPAESRYDIVFRYANASRAELVFDNLSGEHFAGLGHGPFGRVEQLDLQGSAVTIQRAPQAPLLVPFYISSAGYGLFTNNTYATSFDFRGTTQRIAPGAGALDYFVIAGPTLPEVLDRYTALTGRPRLPPLAALGLGLSDKVSQTGADGQGALVSDDAWWREKIQRMRDGSFPFDMVIHDNSWRGAKTGPWRWDLARYPDPAAFAAFCQQRGVINMLDFNRADAAYSEGWRPSFRVPGTPESGEHGGWLDATRADVRSWFWTLLFDQAFDPALHFPADALWLDEPDEDIATAATLGNGRTWDEMGAYYFFLLAKAIGEGWDADMGGTKRLFLMTRGMAAGGQRWSTLWSGDIDPTYDEMRRQIRGMLAAGLSGFPFWAHDAGGFQASPGTDVSMYRSWSLGLGSFSPVWKPHGPGLRFPWDQYAAAEDDMRLYGNLRIELLPYLYATAHAAHARGMPMARPMFLAYPDASEAWSNDLQYLWGDAFLVAPDTSDGGGSVAMWLPPGRWYNFWDDAPIDGPAELEVSAPVGRIPLFVRAGAIVPGALPMAGTQFWDRGASIVDVYAGADGAFELIEDDGVTDAFLDGALRRTLMTWRDAARALTIAAAEGNYQGAPSTRSYRIRIHGLAEPMALAVNGHPMTAIAWDAQRRVLTAEIGSFLVADRVESRLSR